MVLLGKKWLLPLLVLVLLLPSVAVAKPTSAFQKGLPPGAVRVLLRVQQLNEKERYRESLDEIEKYRKESQGRVPALVDFVAGNLDFQLEHYPAAAASYRRVIASEPEFDEAYENLGSALLMLKRYREAVKVLLEAAARQPQKAEKLKYQAAIGALYGEDYRLATKLLRELVRKKSRPPEDWLRALIQAELQLKHPGAAQKTALRLVDLYPEKADNWRLLAEISLTAGKCHDALSAYKVLQANGNLKSGEFKTLAGIYQRLELPGRAAAVWEEYLARQKAPARRDLEVVVSLYRQAGEYDRALAVLERLEKLAPNDDRLRFLRGEILYQAGRWAEARQAFSRVREFPNGKNAGRQYLLAGYCAWNENDFAAAARAWKQAATYPHLRRRASGLLKSLEPWLEEAGTEKSKKRRSSG